MKEFKIIIAGPRDCKNKKLVYEAIEKGINKLGKPTLIISGAATGVDTLAIDYAIEHGINYVKYPADWDNIKIDVAVVKERWCKWKKKIVKYNAVAGHQRNQKMADAADALIAIDFGTSGTSDMINRAKKNGLKIYKYQPNILNEGDFEIEF